LEETIWPHNASKLLAAGYTERETAQQRIGVCTDRIVNAHPDAGSFCDRIAEAYVVGAHLAGHQVQAIVLRDLHFDLMLRGGYAHAGPLEPDLIEQQYLLS
jgi:hypothetical protein